MTQQPDGPWERYGWPVMSSIWLVFLAFPLIEVLTADSLGTAPRALGVTLIAAFAGAYVHGFFRIIRGEPSAVERVGAAHLGVLVALTCALFVLIEEESLGTLPFIVAMAMFTLRPALAIAVTLTCLMLPLVLPALGWVEHGLEFMTLIVALVAITTGTVRVMESRDEEHRRTERELEIVAERDRVARDVHDVLGHSLTVVAAKSELAARMLDADPERARAEILQVQSLARESLAEIRAVVAGLRVTRLSDELVAARAALDTAGIEVEIIGYADSLDPRHRLVAAWVLRESVTNIVRHSGATRCEVTLESHRMVVADDGRGAGGADEGHGLRGVRERVADSGGTVTIGATDGAGTRVEVTW